MMFLSESISWGRELVPNANKFHCKLIVGREM